MLFNDDFKCKDYRPSVIDEWVIMMHWWEYRSSRIKPVPVPLSPPQIPHELAWDWTRASTVRRRQLTAWAITRPTCQCVCGRIAFGCSRIAGGGVNSRWIDDAGQQKQQHAIDMQIHSTQNTQHEVPRHVQLGAVNVSVRDRKILRNDWQYIEWYRLFHVTYMLFDGFATAWQITKHRTRVSG